MRTSVGLVKLPNLEEKFDWRGYIICRRSVRAWSIAVNKIVCRDCKDRISAQRGLAGPQAVPSRSDHRDRYLSKRV
jgi:hypothetical protein